MERRNVKGIMKGRSKGGREVGKNEGRKKRKGA